MFDLYKHIVYTMGMKTLNKAISFFGSQANLAKALKVTPMAVTNWKNRGVPLEVAKQIEKETGGEVTGYDLRPDFFDQPKSA